MIRHIIYSFDKYSAEPREDERKEVMYRDYVMMLNFFLNAHAFICLVKKHEKIDIDKDLLDGVKFFRDCFAHQHDKELIRGGDRYYIPHIRQRATSMLDTLEMRHPDSGIIMYEINFSPCYFFTALKEVFKNFVDNLKS